MNSEDPYLIIANNTPAEGDGPERAAEAVHGVPLRAIDDSSVDRDENALEFDVVAGDGDHSLENWAHSIRTGSRCQVPTDSPQSRYRTLEADLDQVVARDSYRSLRGVNAHRR